MTDDQLNAELRWLIATALGHTYTVEFEWACDDEDLAHYAGLRQRMHAVATELMVRGLMTDKDPR